MASKWTEQKISEWIREGRGRGEGAAYKPWLTVQDVPGNLGRCHRVPSRFGRPIHLLSDVEARVFYAVERSRTVLEAQEQYPIDRATSQAVARALGIRHPCYPGTNIPCVMTVDLMVTMRGRAGGVRVGIDSKTRDQAEDPRVIEKLELTRGCLAESGSRHLILFDSQIPKQLVRNLEWIRSGRPHEKEVLPYPAYLEEATERLHRYLSSALFAKKPLRIVCDEFDQVTGQRTGTALRAAKLLIDSYLLHVDLNGDFLPDRPLCEFSLESAAMDEVRIAV